MVVAQLIHTMTADSVHHPPNLKVAAGRSHIEVSGAGVADGRFADRF